MTAANDIQSELGHLRDELSGQSDGNAGEKRSRHETHTTTGEQLASALRDLGAAFEEAAADTESLISEHPVASLAGAFVLGIVVGRILGNRS